MGPMMMGGGVLAMLFVLLLIVGAPLLIIALVASGRSALRSRRPTEGSQPTASYATASSTGRCPACERGVQPTWNVCPYCGAELGVLEEFS